MDPIKRLHDEMFVTDKIITYKAAAAILNIDINEAKSILQQYSEEYMYDNLSVSYVIGGQTLNGSHKVTIVSNTKYDKIKQNFKKITIDHIYSIQKCPLTDWLQVFNVDDFLYSKSDSPTEVESKPEKIEPISPKKEKISPKNVKVNKKGSLSTFFSQAQNQNKVNIKKEPVEKEQQSKPKKTNALTSFMNKTSNNNKENSSKLINKVEIKKETKDETENYDSDNEDIFVTNKKRARVINDDEDDDTPTKCPKVDILDDPMDCDQNESDQDIFGSPEKEEILSEPEETKETVPSDSTENNTQNTEEEDTVMYQDEDGFFVTEKKHVTPKRSTKKSEKTESKEQLEKKKIEQEKKKEVVQKIKKNTNQNTLFSYFNKK